MTLPQDIGARLASSFGLDPNLCLGPGLEHAIEHCQEQWDIPDIESFFNHLRLSSEAFKAFAEELLIPESWFFRDRAPFRFLQEWVRDVWQPAHPHGVLKVLSLPCAVGQEPYSLAIALMELGLPPERFSVFAGDLSPRLLEQARTGRYRAMAFRGAEFCEREKYFEQEEGNHWRVRDIVRERVSFRMLNLQDPLSYAGEMPYDVIFCRNVLIYFDEKGRRNAIRGLDQALAPDGLLCVGHADALGRITEQYKRVGPPGAFSYSRKPVEAEPVKPAQRETLPRKATPPKRYYTPTAKARLPEPVVEKPVPVSGLPDARTMADAGRLSEAEEVCREAIEKTPGSVEALYLLGEVLLAQKKIPDGEAQMRRVVYLNPGHTEALFRLALLAEQRGDAREAANWRRRATKRQLETSNG